ncbi:MAG: LptA/OstA family protein [Alphaproteobacteria bacterium]
MGSLKNYLIALALLVGTSMGAQAQSGFSFDSFVGEGSKAIEVTADALDVVQSDSVARFVGNVVAQQGALTLKAATISLYYNQGGNGSGGAPVSLIEAKTGVSMASKSEAVTCDWLRYDIEAAQITLGGAVTLTRDGNTLKGEKLTIDLNTGLSRLEGGASSGGRVRGVFVPGQGFQAP